MELINQTLIMSFLGIIAVSSVVFPIIYLVQKSRHHKEMMYMIQRYKDAKKEK